MTSQEKKLSHLWSHRSQRNITATRLVVCEVDQRKGMHDIWAEETLR